MALTRRDNEKAPSSSRPNSGVLSVQVHLVEMDAPARAQPFGNIRRTLPSTRLSQKPKNRSADCGATLRRSRRGRGGRARRIDDGASVHNCRMPAPGWQVASVVPCRGGTCGRRSRSNHRAQQPPMLKLKLLAQTSSVAPSGRRAVKMALHMGVCCCRLPPDGEGPSPRSN